jgi:hypothetical protein
MHRLLATAVVLLLGAAGGAGAAPRPAVSIDNVSVRETNFDIVAVLTATLAAPSAEPVTVQYSTVDGTADATDYVHDSGTLTFAPGTTQVRVPVMIKGDALDEADETLPSSSTWTGVVAPSRSWTTWPTASRSRCSRPRSTPAGRCAAARRGSHGSS